MSVEQYIVDCERSFASDGGTPVRVTKLVCTVCASEVVCAVAVELGVIVDGQFCCGCRWTPGMDGR